MANHAKSKGYFGFLTVVDDPQHGLFGGYLLLNMAGRPLEFHCTAPIRPNRAQEILYGPTLEPFLYGEQIGQTLLRSAKAAAEIVCTDRPAVLAVREHVEIPVAVVLSPDSDTGGKGDSSAGASRSGRPADRTWRRDGPHPASPRITKFEVGHHRLAVSTSNARDQQLVIQRLACLPDSFDLSEPFERIREAIQEARRGG